MRRKAARLAEQEQEQEQGTERYQPRPAEQDVSSQDQLRQEEIEQAELQELEQLEASLPPMEAYVPADTIEGLETIGHKSTWGNWSKASDPKPEDQYSS